MRAHTRNTVSAVGQWARATCASCLRSLMAFAKNICVVRSGQSVRFGGGVCVCVCRPTVHDAVAVVARCRVIVCRRIGQRVSCLHKISNETEKRARCVEPECRGWSENFGGGISRMCAPGPGPPSGHWFVWSLSVCARNQCGRLGG